VTSPEPSRVDLRGLGPVQRIVDRLAVAAWSVL
jgi:hypothetical protein